MENRMETTLVYRVDVRVLRFRANGMRPLREEAPVISR